jgi:myo-inositol-1(or 4)-monophosphatase
LIEILKKYIRTLIHKSFCNDSIIGEELKINFFNDYLWCIDPIDGTRAFIIGAPTWSNLIGLSFQNKPVLGLVNFPELNKYYISDKKKSYVVKDKKNLF